MAEAKDPSEIIDDEWSEEVAEDEHAIHRVHKCEGNLGEGDQTLDLRALPEAVSKENEKESTMLYVAQSGRDQFEQTKQRRQDDKRLLSLKVTRKLSQKPGDWEHTAARAKDTQDIDPYSAHMIKKIESSRAEPFLVKSQTDQSEHGSLRFTINPPTQKHGSERDGSRDQQSSSSTRRVTAPEGGEIDTPVKSTIQMPVAGSSEQTGARPKEKIDGRDGSGNQVSASSSGLVTKPLLNSAKGSEMDHHVPSTIQMSALGESQPPMAGLPLATPGIYPWFLARHSRDQYLCGGSAVGNAAAPGNELEVRSAVVPPIDNSSPALGGSQPSEYLGCSSIVSLGESQPPMARLPLATPGIYCWFLARNSTDQFFCGGSAVSNIAAPGNDPGRGSVVLPPNDNITDTRSQMGPVVESQNLVIDGHQCPIHRNVPTEHDDIGTWNSS